jgi:hypothetical protein
MLNFSMHQSGIDCKCPYSNRPLKPLTPLIGSTQSLFIGTQDRKSPYLFNWYMRSAVDLYHSWVGPNVSHPLRELKVAEQGYLAPLDHGAGSSCRSPYALALMFPPKLSSHRAHGAAGLRRQQERRR